MKIIKNRVGITIIEVIASVFVVGVSLIVITAVLKMGTMKYRELRAFEDLQTNAFRILVNLEKGGAAKRNPTQFENSDFNEFEYRSFRSIVPKYGLMYAQQYQLLNSRTVKAIYQLPENATPQENNTSFAEFQFTPKTGETGIITMRSRMVKSGANTIQLLDEMAEDVLFPFDRRNKGIAASGSNYFEIDEDITDSADMQDNLRFTVYDFIIEDCEFELVRFVGSNIYPGENDIGGTQRHDGVRVTLTCLYRYPTLNPFDSQLRTRRVQFEKIISRRN